MIPRPLRRLAADLRAHRLLHAVTVLTVALSTLVVGGTLLAGVNAAEALAAWRRETRILVHLRPLAAPEREELERRLRAAEGVAAVRFLPREEAFAELRRHFPNLELLFEPFEDPPLPDAFEVEPREPALAAVERLARALRALPEVEEVAYPRRALEGLQAFLDFLRRGGLLLLGLAILAAVAMVAATTRLVLHARREEIELLRLFGAGWGLLHGRFLLGGLLHGAAGGGLGLGLLRGLFDALLPAAAPLAHAAGLAPRFLSAAEAAGLVAGAAAAGAIGALAPLGRGSRGVPGWLFALAAGLLLAVAVRAAAAEPAGDAAAVDPLQQEAEVLRRGQREMEADLERLRRRETDVAAALDQAARRLAESRRRAAAARAEHEALAHRVRLLQEARSDLEGRLAELKRALAKRLRALYGVHRLGPAASGGALAASPVERQRAEAGLERLLAHDARLLSALAEDAAELAGLQAGIEADSARLAERLAQLAADGSPVLCTCSTIGGLAESSHPNVLRVDRPMAERAVSLGRRIGVAATLQSTIVPTTALLHDAARKADKAVELTEIFIRSAWPFMERGDAEGYAREIAARLAEACAAQTFDVIVLAQASMAVAEPLCADLPCPVLSSPRLGLLAAISACRAHLSDTLSSNARLNS